MSTSLLYHGFGIRGYRYVRTEYVEGGVVFRIEQDLATCRGSVCGSARVAPRGRVDRAFRSLPSGGKPVTVRLAIPRVACQNCGAIRQTPIGFADPRRTDTKAFQRYALELSQYMTILDVARHLGISWDVIKDLQKRHLQRRFSKPKLKPLKQLAIDEISGAKIEAVAIDMSPAYIAAVASYLPKATVVFDRFHVMKLDNDKLSDLRRDLYHEAQDKMHKDVLKGSRWLLLKRPEHWEEARHERTRLEEALRLNQPLATAYYLKEDLAEVWEQDDEEQATAFLLDWVRRAESSGIRMLKKFAKTIRAHALQIPAYYDYPISTGPLEGTNNKIKTMKRQAYGFRDQEFFKLKILGIHESKYALVG